VEDTVPADARPGISRKGLLAGEPGYFIAIVEAHCAFLYWIFFGNKRWKPAKRAKLTALKGVYRGNLVWQHFVLKKNHFSAVMNAKKKSR
jgi:hypothetical protein